MLRQSCKKGSGVRSQVCKVRKADVNPTVMGRVHLPFRQFSGSSHSVILKNSQGQNYWRNSCTLALYWLAF